MTAKLIAHSLFTVPVDSPQGFSHWDVHYGNQIIGEIWRNGDNYVTYENEKIVSLHPSLSESATWVFEMHEANQ